MASGSNPSPPVSTTSPSPKPRHPYSMSTILPIVLLVLVVSIPQSKCEGEPLEWYKDVSARAMKVLPQNLEISPDVLVKLSTQVLPDVAKKFQIPASKPVVKSVFGVKKEYENCPVSEGWDGQMKRRGCYLSMFVCDTEVTGRCYWTFWRACACPKLWIFKLYECRISPSDVPLPGKFGPSKISVPIGECVLSVWILVVSVAVGAALLWYIVFRSVRIAYKKLY